MHRKRSGGPLSAAEHAEIDIDIETPECELHADDIEGTHERAPDVDEVTPEDEDNCIGAEVNLIHQGQTLAGKAWKRAQNADGELTGTKNDNPLLDTRVCEVEFPDGNVAEYSANVIAENMFAMCDPDGNQHLLMDTIIDHKTDDTAVKFADHFIVKNGRQHYQKTTQGWMLCISWKDGTASWEPLASAKESCPIEVAEHAAQHDVDHEPAFAGGCHTC